MKKWKKTTLKIAIPVALNALWIWNGEGATVPRLLFGNALVLGVPILLGYKWYKW